MEYLVGAAVNPVDSVQGGIDATKPAFDNLFAWLKYVLSILGEFGIAFGLLICAIVYAYLLKKVLPKIGTGGLALTIIRWALIVFIVGSVGAALYFFVSFFQKAF
jgi:hypothetical protein